MQPQSDQQGHRACESNRFSCQLCPLVQYYETNEQAVLAGWTFKDGLLICPVCRNRIGEK